jgi:hypothetical protein
MAFIGIGPGWLDVTAALTVALAVVVVVPVALVALLSLGSGPSLGLLSAVAVWVLLVGVCATALYRRVAGRSGREGTDASTVWDAIPSWQYDGRHVESGGFTLDEQERALDEIQETAAEMERRTRD